MKSKKFDKPIIRLGYAALHSGLREQQVFSNRTARLKTIQDKGTEYAISLAQKNLNDVLTILEANEKLGIRFFRLSSNMFPHATNPALMTSTQSKDPRSLAYDISTLIPVLKSIGNYAKKHGHRLTFHPDPFISLGTRNPDILLRNHRELWFHSHLLDIMELDLNSVIIIHGGGLYVTEKLVEKYSKKHILEDLDTRAHLALMTMVPRIDRSENREYRRPAGSQLVSSRCKLKAKTMRRWKKSFNALPDEIKRRVILENDEFSYSIDDVLTLSSMVEKNSGSADSGYNIPIVFDIFHYSCYQDTAEKQNIPAQSSITSALKAVELSWRSDRIPKMHVSQQRPNASKGAHSDYITELPDYILSYTKIFKRSLDVMIEAKCKEKAVMELYEKYPQLQNNKR